MKNSKTLRLFIASASIAIMMSCSDDDSPAPEPQADYQEILTNVANNVIVETYIDLASKAEDLLVEAKDLKKKKTVSNFDNTKQAWRSARDPWEKSEGFLFGPVDTQGLDPAIDSWPVNVNDMEALLSAIKKHPEITEEIVDQQVNEAKGFHLIEYLLWGLNGDKQVNDFTPRELEYLVAACENLRDKTVALSDAWINTGGNYVANFLNAGNSGIYPSQKAALEDIVTGMITIADEVANGKIETPLNGEDGGGVDPTQEESRFSHNSKLDFANNIRSISNTYNGTYSVDGAGVSDVVAKVNSNLDTQFKSEITAAIQAIEAIPGTFSDAVINNRPAVKTAQAKVSKVLQTLKSSIKPLISDL